eukprot:TRINITY_DN17800_c0_g1_i1.p1 TRINITY_DN17800_c0_g1~~TRINITY_DN17800_c0_g1_i1.p1  ORF type:complete len:718 (-),score=129.89 TRINITY_DN17800_c0_g1_i1:212-2326(-)
MPAPLRSQTPLAWDGEIQPRSAAPSKRASKPAARNSSKHRQAYHLEVTELDSSGRMTPSKSETSRADMQTAHDFDEASSKLQTDIRKLMQRHDVAVRTVLDSWLFNERQRFKDAGRTQEAADTSGAPSAQPSPIRKAVNDSPDLPAMPALPTGNPGQLHEGEIPGVASIPDISDRPGISKNRRTEMNAAPVAELCEHCGNVFAKDSVFCRKCGKPRKQKIWVEDDKDEDEAEEVEEVAALCVSCGNIFASDAIFCRKCGAQRPKSKKKKKNKNRQPTRKLSIFGPSKDDWNRLQQLTHSRSYEIASGFLILSNSVFIGYHTSFMAWRAMDDASHNRIQNKAIPEAFFALQLVFTSLFSVDLLLRWVADGFLAFLKSADVGWNILDILVVCSSLIDMGVEIEQKVSRSEGDKSLMANFSVLKVLRVVRIVRIAHIIRVMRFFRELRMMVFSILGSFKSLLWVGTILGLCFYIFGISFVAAATSFLDKSEMWSDPAYSDLVEYFGSLDSAIIALYMSMSGGNDWAIYYVALQKIGSIYHQLFLLFITFAIFAVVNIVTGVFVDTAMQSNSADKEIVVREELEAMQAYLGKVQELFFAIDYDSNGTISADELDVAFQDPHVLAYFRALKVDIADALNLFRLLDSDGSGDISIQEFLEGFRNFHGEARALDTKMMQMEIRNISDQVQTLYKKMGCGKEPSANSKSQSA